MKTRERDGVVRIEDVDNSRLEELLLAIEVVVERTHSHVGRLGDLQNRNVESARRDERLCRLDQRRAGALLASHQPVGGIGLIAHGCGLQIAVRPVDSNSHHY